MLEGFRALSPNNGESNAKLNGHWDYTRADRRRDRRRRRVVAVDVVVLAVVVVAAVVVLAVVVVSVGGAVVVEMTSKKNKKKHAVIHLMRNPMLNVNALAADSTAIM